MQPLADTLRRAPVPAGEAVQLAAALADALAAKVRDKTRPPRITPGSVLIGRRDDGTLTVEFKSGNLPAPSGPVGADERAAVQELGVICYRLLTGKPPIKGNVGLIRDLEAAVSSSPQPDALKALVLELISVDPSRRPGLETAAERFVAIARGTPLPSAPVAGSPAPLPPPPRAGGARATTPPPTPPRPASAESSTPRPAPPPITVQPLEAPPDLIPAAPVLPAEPVVVASTTRNKKKKNSTDTQERLFFAEGERLAAEERADAGLDTAEGGERTDIDVERVGGGWWRERRVLIAGAGGAVLLLLLLYVAFGRGGGGDKGEKTDDPLAPSAAKAPEDPVDTAKVAAAPEPQPAAATTAAQPEPAAAEPAPAAAAEPEPPAAAEPEPAPAKPASKKPSSSAKSKTSAKTPPPPAKPAAKPTPKPSSSSSDPMAQAKAARSRGKSSEAYNYYAQAARSGKNVGAATYGMAEMAYAMKKYGDAISLAKKAMGKGASEKACWKIIARSHCARNEGRSAWFAFSKAGGGDCP